MSWGVKRQARPPHFSLHSVIQFSSQVALEKKKLVETVVSITPRVLVISKPHSRKSLPAHQDLLFPGVFGQDQAVPQPPTWPHSRTQAGPSAELLPGEMRREQAVLGIPPFVSRSATRSHKCKHPLSPKSHLWHTRAPQHSHPLDIPNYCINPWLPPNTHRLNTTHRCTEGSLH